MMSFVCSWHLHLTDCFRPGIFAYVSGVMSESCWGSVDNVAFFVQCLNNLTFLVDPVHWPDILLLYTYEKLLNSTKRSIQWSNTIG